MKPVRIYVLNGGIDPYATSGDDDIYAVAEWELALIGSSPEKLENDTNCRGRWLVLDLKPAISRLDREAKQLTLVGDAITGFRRDDLLLPAANFATFISSWEWEGPKAPDLAKPSFDLFEDLHPNLSDRIRMSIERHIRPNMSSDPDFLSRLRGSSPQSSETSPSGSEPTTSTPE